MITRQGNFRIEPTASGAGFKVFSSDEKIKILSMKFTGTPADFHLHSALEIGGEVFVFKATIGRLRDDNGKSIVVDGKDYGLVWQNIRLNGVVSSSENEVFSGGFIHDQKKYSYFAELVVELLSDLRYVCNDPPVRRIVFSEFESYKPKSIEVVPK